MQTTSHEGTSRRRAVLAGSTFLGRSGPPDCADGQVTVVLDPGCRWVLRALVQPPPERA